MREKRERVQNAHRQGFSLSRLSRAILFYALCLVDSAGLVPASAIEDAKVYKIKHKKRTAKGREQGKQPVSDEVSAGLIFAYLKKK